MVKVRKVRVAVKHGLVLMAVAVGLARWVAGIVRVLVMLVVPVEVFMHQRFMEMLVLVVLRQVEPHSNGHQAA